MAKNIMSDPDNPLKFSFFMVWSVVLLSKLTKVDLLGHSLCYTCFIIVNQIILYYILLFIILISFLFKFLLSALYFVLIEPSAWLMVILLGHWLRIFRQEFRLPTWQPHLPLRWSPVLSMIVWSWMVHSFHPSSVLLFGLLTLLSLADKKPLLTETSSWLDTSLSFL